MLAVGGAAAGAATETIPKVPGSGGSGAGQAGPGAGAGYAAGGGAFGAGPSGGSPYGGSGSGSAPWSGEQATRPRPKPAVLVGAGVAAVIVIVLIIVFATGGSGKSNAAAGSVATKTAGASKPGVGASKGATTGAGAGGSAGASSGATGGSGGSGATSGAGGGSGSGTGGGGLQTFPATLATVPASPGQAVQQVQSVVGQASGELTGTEQGQLAQVVNTLSQEVSSGQSISTGMTQFWALLHSGELPSSLNTYLEQYAMYLSASQGS